MGAHWARGQWGGGGRAGRRRNGESALRPSTPSLQTAHVSGELRARGCSPHPPPPQTGAPAQTVVRRPQPLGRVTVFCARPTPLLTAGLPPCGLHSGSCPGHAGPRTDGGRDGWDLLQGHRPRVLLPA